MRYCSSRGRGFEPPAIHLKGLSVTLVRPFKRLPRRLQICPNGKIFRSKLESTLKLLDRFPEARLSHGHVTQMV